MDKQSLKVNNSIIRISGIFESDLNSVTDRKFKEACSRVKNSSREVSVSSIISIIWFLII